MTLFISVHEKKLFTGIIESKSREYKDLKINEEISFTNRHAESYSSYVSGLKNSLHRYELESIDIFIIHFGNSDDAVELAEILKENGCNRIVILNALISIKNIFKDSEKSSSYILKIAGLNYSFRMYSKEHLEPIEYDKRADRIILPPEIVVNFGNRIIPYESAVDSSKDKAPILTNEQMLISDWIKSMETFQKINEQLIQLVSTETKNVSSHRRIIINACCALALARMNENERNSIKSVNQIIGLVHKYLHKDDLLLQLFEELQNKIQLLRKNRTFELPENVLSALLDFVVVDGLNNAKVVDEIVYQLRIENADSIWRKWNEEKTST